MKRSQQLELMDLPISSQELLAGELKNLRRLNRWLGGYRGIETALADLVREPRPEHLSLLDIGTGSADIPGRVVRWCRRRRIDVSIVALDLDPLATTLAAQAVKHYPEISVVRGDAAQPPFAPESFDVVLASQFLHHFSEEQVVALLKNWSQLARQAVIVSDLLRHPLAYYGAQVLPRLFTRNIMTLTDAPLSILRAFTLSEWRELCRRAAPDEFRVTPVFPFRVVARLGGSR
ncbi:MAG TPA: methyltransferase domain-containing protein [Candidatus Binatia bacterium]